MRETEEGVGGVGAEGGKETGGGKGGGGGGGLGGGGGGGRGAGQSGSRSQTGGDEDDKPCQAEAASEEILSPIHTADLCRVHGIIHVFFCSHRSLRPQKPQGLFYYGRVNDGRGKREIIYLSLHCHHQNDSCIKTSSVRAILTFH